LAQVVNILVWKGKIKRSQPSAAPTGLMQSNVGAAEGCDLLICPQKRPPEGGLFFVTPLAQALPDQQL
jgi:hypothetical protein